MSMDPLMKTALQGKAPLLATFVDIEFTDRTVRLSDGGVFSWNGNTYAPEDAEVGTLNGFSEFTETEGTESPRLEVAFEYKTNAALSRLANPASQGTPVNVYAAVIDRPTGLVVGEPELLFSGVIDDADLRHSTNNRMLTIYLSTAWELLFDDNEGARWNNDFWVHNYGSSAQAFYAVTDVQRKMFWGYKGPQNGSGGGYGGYGGGYIGGVWFLNHSNGDSGWQADS